MLDLDVINKIHENISNALTDDYILITSPCDISKVDGDAKIIKIDSKEYSSNELIDIIKEKS